MSYPGITPEDGLSNAPDLQIPPRYLLGAVCTAGGAACPLFADPREAESILALLRGNPAATIRLVSDVDCIPHYPAVLSAGGWSLLDRAALLDRGRDLDVLQRLGLAPGDTRRARFLVELLLDRVETPREICAGDTAGWEGCNKARSGAYETARGHGASSIVYDRPEAEKAEALRRNAERIRTRPVLHVRPHHLMCMSCWHGDGTKLAARDNDTLDLLWERIRRDPELEIVLVEGNCEACYCCDGFHPSSTRCVHAGGLIRDYKKDLDVLRLIGLFPGDRMNARELLCLIYDRIASTRLVCGFGDGTQTSGEWSVCGGADGHPGYEAARRTVPALLR